MLHFEQMGEQVVFEGFGQHGDPVLVALACTYGQGALLEVDIFDPKTQAFIEPQAATVNEPRHELMRAAEMLENSVHFVFFENYRKSASCLGSHGVGKIAQIAVKDVAEKEEQAVESLVLCGGGHMPLCGEMTEKAFDISGVELVGRFAAHEAIESAQPLEVRSFGGKGTLPKAQGFAHLPGNLPPCIVCVHGCVQLGVRKKRKILKASLAWLICHSSLDLERRRRKGSIWLSSVGRAPCLSQKDRKLLTQKTK